MPKAFIGIGLPRSGKTPLLKELASTDNCTYICASEIRRQLYFRAPKRPLGELVWNEVYQRIQEALSSGQNVVVDASNIREEDRRDLVSHCRKFAKNIIGVWFDTPLEVCLQRNREMQGDHIPERVIREMAQSLKWNPPTHRDGFDELLIIDR